LLATGKTDLLQRFISKKGRPFKAYLIKNAEGRVGFEFEPRKSKAASATSSAPLPVETKKPATPPRKPLKKTTKPANRKKHG
ncbi:MAG: topoisomerase C-terminal repeat-containing protein, partial [Burkholderiales bacterium]